MVERELLRFLTAGSVDDGKSTLIERLLHDTNSIHEGQFACIRASSSANGNGGIEFSLVTEGLRAECEEGITIDVAYRSFSSAKRRFIIADTSGHEQYTRNLATGASTASAAVLLIDARKGVLPQTHRHAAIAWLLGIRQFAVAVNKMDLAGFDERVFREIEDAFRNFVVRLEAAEAHFIPTCAIAGDNVVERSERMPWFRGMPLLEYLENIPVSSNAPFEGFRMPVQCAIHSRDGRQYTGQIASGMIHKGDAIRVLPSGQTTHVAWIRLGGSEIDGATAPLSVAVGLEKDLEISRGDMLAAPDDSPLLSCRFTATLLWIGGRPLETGRPYLLKHTTRQVCASIARVNAVLNPVTMEREPSEQLRLNEFGEVEIETHQPLYLDAYSTNRLTGSFILIDPLENGTLGAGMIASSATPAPAQQSIAGSGLAVWFTGLSSAGKSTVSKIVYETLGAMGHKVEWLDGDQVRQHLNRGLGFSKEDRDENVRRMGFMAELLARQGTIVLVSAISPYREIRDEIRRRIGNFIEVYVHAPLEVCEERDLKGIYRRARRGEMHGVTGVDDPYEPPLGPEIECRTDRETPAESAKRVLDGILAWLAARTS